MSIRSCFPAGILGLCLATAACGGASTTQAEPVDIPFATDSEATIADRPPASTAVVVPSATMRTIAATAVHSAPGSLYTQVRQLDEGALVLTTGVRVTGVNEAWIEEWIEVSIDSDAGTGWVASSMLDDHDPAS